MKLTEIDLLRRKDVCHKRKHIKKKKNQKKDTSEAESASLPCVCSAAPKRGGEGRQSEQENARNKPETSQHFQKYKPIDLRMPVKQGRLLHQENFI